MKCFEIKWGHDQGSQNILNVEIKYQNKYINKYILIKLKVLASGDKETSGDLTCLHNLNLNWPLSLVPRPQINEYWSIFTALKIYISKKNNPLVRS